MEREREIERTSSALIRGGVGQRRSREELADINRGRRQRQGGADVGGGDAIDEVVHGIGEVRRPVW
jgi:hypothetical protein